MGIMQQDSATFNFTVSGGAANNCYIPCFLTIKLDTATIYTQGVYIPVGTPTPIVVIDDNASSFANWTAGGTASTWNTSTAQSHTAPTSFTESPSGNYPANCDLHMTLTTPLNVNANPVVTLSFWHRYVTELDYDYCRVEVSNDGGANWQLVKQYSGSSTTWTQQTFDISAYANGSTNLKVRFRLTSDAGLQSDGWYVDDINISKYCVGSITGISNNTGLPVQFSLAQNYPNPFNPSTLIKYQLPKAAYVKISVFDVLGKVAATLIDGNVDAGYHQIEFNGSELSSGLYFYRIETDGFTDVKKMILVK